MHTHSIEHWRYDHDYLPPSQRASERRTLLALALTIIMMVAELITGYATGSLALTADGWHMGSHAVALGISAFAYAFSRRHVANTRFTFGTGKVGPLAGYTSALILGAVALSMVVQSVEHLLKPGLIEFDEALWVAVIGLAVNMACIAILGGGHVSAPHNHAGEPAKDVAQARAGHTHRHDHNMRATYMHVVADALTSVLAIIALLAGKYLGWNWVDASMGIVGAILIGRWAVGIVRTSAHALLDAEDNRELVTAVTRLIENDADNRIADLHVWRLGPLSHACIVSVLTHQPRPAEHYKALLAAVPGLDHVTIEVNVCCS